MSGEAWAIGVGSRSSTPMYVFASSVRGSMLRCICANCGALRVRNVHEPWVEGW